jgi:hypothetical protein
MRNELAMRLFSRRSLTESAAKEQITALSDFDRGLMRPDRCGEFEPIKKPFNPADVSEQVRWLAKPHGEFLYQKGRPMHLSGAMWNLTRSPNARFPAGPFTNYWTGEFDGKWAHRVGIEKVEDFVAEMFRVTRSDFGLLTTEVDLKAKNCPTNSYSYAGMDLVTGIPGLYWINVFSNELAGWLGLSDLPERVASLRRFDVGGAVWLKFCDSLDDCRSLETLGREHAAIEWLGPQRFFDIRFPDRKAETPDWYHLPSEHAG